MFRILSNDTIIVIAINMADLGDCTFRKKVKNVEKDKLKVLECRVCDEVFTLEGNKIPRLLHCGHTVCHSCLMRLPLRENSIQCPFDRQSTPTGDSGVLGLKKNFALLELLEGVQCKCAPSSSSHFLNFYHKEEEPTVWCDEDDRHLADKYCTVCDTNLCEDCAELTHATKTLSRHRRVPLAEKPKDKLKCPFHPSHVAEFTCLEDDCKSRAPLMCCICKDYGKHKSHKHSLVETEADAIRSTVSAALAGISVFMESVQDTSRKIEQVIEKMEGTDTETGTGLFAQARVHFHFEKLRETLTQQEHVARAVVDTYLRERLCSLRQTKEHLASALSQVESTCSQVQQIMREEDARIVLASKELEEAVVSVQTTLAQFAELGGKNLQPDPNIPITFTKDNRVHIGPKIEMRVVTLGLNGAGKTSILFKLKQNEFMAMIPTIGFNVETIDYKNIKFTIWDVGGQPKLRPLWKHYYFNTQAVVFVVDSTAQDRLPEVHTELVKLLAEKELAEASFLILANKQDVEGCMSLEALMEGLSLNKLCCGRSWHMEACSSQNGQGLVEALDWLARQLLASGVNDPAVRDTD